MSHKSFRSMVKSFEAFSWKRRSMVGEGHGFKWSLWRLTKRWFFLTVLIYMSLDIHKYPQNSPRIFWTNIFQKACQCCSLWKQWFSFFVFSKTSWTMSRFPPKQLKNSWFLPWRQCFQLAGLSKKSRKISPQRGVLFRGFRNLLQFWSFGLEASFCGLCTLPKAHITFSPLKNGGWETIFLSFWVLAYSQFDLLVLGRVLVANVTIDPLHDSFTDGLALVAVEVSYGWGLGCVHIAELRKPFCDKVIKLKDFKIKTMILRVIPPENGIQYI